MRSTNEIPAAPYVRLCQGLENAGGDGSGPGTVLAKLRERFVAADSNKSGFLDGAKFRAVLADLPGTEGLTVSAKTINS